MAGEGGRKGENWDVVGWRRARRKRKRVVVGVVVSRILGDPGSPLQCRMRNASGGFGGASRGSCVRPLGCHGSSERISVVGMLVMGNLDA